MTIKYGETLRDEIQDHFVVQVQWFDKERPDKEFGSYFVSAFDDIDHRSRSSRAYGTFDKMNPDVADVPSRVKQATDRTAQFTDPEAAFAYAKRLSERGRLVAAQGAEPWRHNYEGPLKTRVVRKTKTETVRIVEEVL